MTADRFTRRHLPLRWRLVVAALVGAVGFAVGFGAFATWEVDHLEDRGVVSALVARLELVRTELRQDGRLAASEPSPRTSLVQVLSPDGTVRDATATLRRQPPLIKLADILEAGGSGERREIQLRHSAITLLGVPLRMTASGAGPAGRGAVIVGLDSEGFLTARQHLQFILLVGLGVIVPLAGLLAWVLAGRALRTVTDLTEEAEAVGVSDIGRGLAVPARDPELSRLVTALNRMLRRIADGLEQERRFAADASHRLRTPLATLRAEAELALADGDTAGMQNALEQVIADADNLTGLVNRLLAAHRRGPDDIQPLAAVVTAAETRWRRQAGSAGLELSCAFDCKGDGADGGHAAAAPVDGADGTDAFAAMPVHHIDPHVLRAVIDPLVENAVQHTNGGPVSVHLVDEGSDLVVDVRDTGNGVAPEIRDRLFRPWTTTRAERGGAGLGLWLARESAQAAGGDVMLVDHRPGHTTFRARLPLA
jgi:signal transduction histidine kinase